MENLDKILNYKQKKILLEIIESLEKQKKKTHSVTEIAFLIGFEDKLSLLQEYLDIYTEFLDILEKYSRKALSMQTVKYKLNKELDLEKVKEDLKSTLSNKKLTSYL